MPICQKILRAGQWNTSQDQIVLDYDGRMLRRKRVETAGGAGFMVDLAETVSLNEGDAFELIDGRVIAVVAAEELVAIVTGNLPRLAWHIGNRHSPCEVTATHLVIRRDPVLEQMVVGLGGQIATAIAPFRPEGGAYGFGRTMGHSHA
jgi:urease accessory protein